MKWYHHVIGVAICTALILVFGAGLWFWLQVIRMALYGAL